MVMCLNCGKCEDIKNIRKHNCDEMILKDFLTFLLGVGEYAK